MVHNRKFLLNSYRQPGQNLTDSLKLVDEDLSLDLKDGEVAVRNVLLSLDPTNAIWATDAPQYLPVIPLGETFRGLTIGRVIASKDPQFPVGSWVTGALGWQDVFKGVGKLVGLSLVPFDGKQDLNLFFGLLGMVGMTAYFGYTECCHPKEGDVVVVSGAAGAVGSLVGQIAKLTGASKVIGIAGGAEKCKRVVEEFGFDACIDYKSESVAEKLKTLAPGGVDVYFDNVGGEITEAIYHQMKVFGRVALCGLISSYKSRDTSSFGAYEQILHRRLNVRGFIVTDFAKDYAKGAAALAKWYSEGKIKFRVDERRVDLKDAPAVFDDLLTGKNEGKLLVRLCENDAASL